MQRWEYWQGTPEWERQKAGRGDSQRVIVADGHVFETVNAWLNYFGAQGYELVSVTPKLVKANDFTSEWQEYLYIFKRQA